MTFFWRLKPDKQNEGILFKLAQSGDKESLDILLEMNRVPLHKFLSYKFQQLDKLCLIDDAIQNTFIQISDQIERIRLVSGSFRTYLFRVGYNRCLDLTRSQKRRSEIPPDPDGDIPYIEEGFEASNNNLDLKKALVHLSDKERLIIKLYYIDCKTLKTIGLMIGKSEGQVSRDLSSIYRKLKDLMEIED